MSHRADIDHIVYTDSDVSSRLTRDPNARPSPREMLEHPWIVSVMQHKIDMAYWMRKVWGWPKDRKKSDR